MALAAVQSIGIGWLMWLLLLQIFCIFSSKCFACSVARKYSRRLWSLGRSSCCNWSTRQREGTTLVMLLVSKGKLSGFGWRRLDMQHTCRGTRKCGRVKGSATGSSGIWIELIEETQLSLSESSAHRLDCLIAEIMGSLWQPRRDAMHIGGNWLENLTFSCTGRRHKRKWTGTFEQPNGPLHSSAGGWQSDLKDFPSLVTTKWFTALTDASSTIQKLCGDGGCRPEPVFKGPLCFSSSLLQSFITLTVPCLAESDGCLHGVHSRRGSTHRF